MKLAIIPARGGSKRIKNKNIVDFCGRPLISYPLEIALNSQLFDEIHVSTDSYEIKKVVEDLGYPVPFMRSEELSTDHVSIIPVLKWVVQEYQRRGRNFDEVALILPTAPLLQTHDLVVAYQKFVNENRKSPTMSCSQYPVPIEWALHLRQDGLLYPEQAANLQKRSQDLGAAYFDVGAFSFLTTKHIVEGFEPRYIPHFLPRERAVDIDTIEDLRFAEILYRGLKLEKPKGES